VRIASLTASGTFGGVLAAETRSELLKAMRLPVFIIPTLVFPALFYVLFGIVLGGGAPGGITMPSYMLATYGTFGVVGAALFGMGVGVAAERGQGWLTLKSATPMPPLAYFGAKVLMSMILGLLIFALLSVLAVIMGGVRLPASSWGAMALVLTLGTVPFCALGCALGYMTGPNSAPAIANMIYLPMSLLSGLWIPLEFMPAVVRGIAPFMPPYHIARLALGSIGMETRVTFHVTALAACTVLFLGAAVLAYRRDDGRTWG
jgi:ABC-2 type transport system permease protein